MRRPRAARMVLSRQSTRYGDSGRPSRRFTPPQAVIVEDRLDQLSAVEAAHYEFPPSISAMVIARIAHVGGHEVRQFRADQMSPLIRNN